MKEVLGIDVLRKHESLLDEEGSRLLQAIYSTPIEFDRHLRRLLHDQFNAKVKLLRWSRFSSSLSLRLVYGFEAMDIDDPHILLAEEMMQLSEYAVIAGWLVDFFPSCVSSIFNIYLHANSSYSEVLTQVVTRCWIQKKGRILSTQSARDDICTV